jgi:predicted ATPase
MIDRIAGNNLLPLSIRQDIIERTDGIPLFVEEMTKAVLEAGSCQGAERAAMSVPAPSSAVPASLHASLMARLDRLGSAKQVAQIGAVIGREFSHVLLASVDGGPEDELQSKLERLVEAGLLFRQGVAPHATYLFKHGLVQDAAYSTLLRERRRALHGRVAEALETQFLEIAESRPEIVARHCTEAALIEKAVRLWGKAGQRSLARSALKEAAEHFSRALAQITILPATAELRREEIKLQVGIITPLIHVKGYAAPETKAATERARLLVKQAEMLGEPPEDPLLLFSVLYGVWVANLFAINGDAIRELAAQFLALAEKQGETAMIMIGRRLMGMSLMCTGDVAESRAHYNQALMLYDPAEHRPLAMRFGQDIRVAILFNRSWGLWLLGYPEAALADADHALKDAREIGHAATLIYALCFTSVVHLQCGGYATAYTQCDEAIALADQKGAMLLKAAGMLTIGGVLTTTDKATDAVHIITSGMTLWRSTGATLSMPGFLSYLAMAYARLGKFVDAWRCLRKAMTLIETTKEALWEAEVHRIAGEIALMSPERDAAKAKAYFERALAVARSQQAKSWELRAAMSMARLWRDQGKRDEARELLAPVYDWFTEGFDTLDLKQVKALLDELA